MQSWAGAGAGWEDEGGCLGAGGPRGAWSPEESGSWRKKGAALGRVTPWWSPGAELVTGGVVAGTRQAMGV